MALDNGDPWFQVMVGHWWTPSIDLGVVNAAATKRQTTSATWHNFSEQLRQQSTTSLNPDIQKGITADNLRDTFNWGADQAGSIANTNNVISESHGSAHHCASELNSRLESIALEGKNEINRIQASKELAPVKLGKIVDEVMRRQQEANSAAAPSTQNVFEAIQKILDQRGIPMSARQFAQQNGIDTTRMLGSPNKEAVTERIKGLLGEGGDPIAPAPGTEQNAFGNPVLQGQIPPAPPSHGNPVEQLGASQLQTTPAPPLPPGSPGGVGSQQLGNPVVQTPPAMPGRLNSSPLNGPPASPGIPGASSPLSMSGLSNGLPTNAFSPSAMGSVPQPNGLMQGLNPGLGQGAPMPSALTNMPPVSPVQPQVPAQAMSDLSASTMPSAGHAPAFDAPAPPPAPPATSASTP